jgi:beta-galactosidase
MKEFNYQLTKSPAFFQDHRESPHSDHSYTLPEGDAKLSLNGDWYFHYAENYEGTIPDFFAAGVDCRGWATLPVPSHPQLHGYGRPQYVNTQYPWDGCEDVKVGEVPEKFNPVSSYVKYFTLPEHMAGKRVFISFQGAESGLAVWCNGRYVGYGEDGFTPSEFELTAYLQPGENKLAAQVFQYTNASWIEDQDFFRFSGIFREVYLYAVPAVHIRDMKITTPLSDDFTSGEVRVAMEAIGEGKAHCRLYQGGALVAEACSQLPQDGETVLPVPNPKLWSAEKPFLYSLAIDVFDASGTLTETIGEKVGMRRFEIKDGLMLLNGKRILFRGTNRHEFSSRAGRCVTEDETELDIRTMKQNNINAVRTSHYPNQSFFYRLCDKYGMYVIDEMNLESHGSWEMRDGSRISKEEHVPGSVPQWREAVLARAEAMLRRDRNRPSVLIWSCGNESAGGDNLLAVSEYFRSMDTRPVHYESVVHEPEYAKTSDIFSNMYWRAESIRKALEKDSSRPAISCEYAHAMGSSFGGQDVYIKLADEVPAYQGGFIWDYIDQAVTKKDRYGLRYQGYGGDFDDRPHDGDFSGDGIVDSLHRAPTPKMQEVKYLYQDLQIHVSDGKAEIINRYLFTGSGEFDCVVQLYREGVLVSQTLMETAVPPCESRTYDLPLWPETLDTEYSVIVSFRLRQDGEWAKQGHEVAFGQWAGGEMPKPAYPSEGPEVIDGAWNLGVRGKDFHVIFSKTMGGIISYRYKGREMLKTMLVPSFWRAPTDNDRGCKAPVRYAQWKLASLYPVNQNPDGLKPGEQTWNIQRGENWVEMAYLYEMPTTPAASCRLAFRVFAGGAVETTLYSDAPKVLGPAPEFGVTLKMDADFHRLRWYGPGPEATYCDRKSGGKLGVWETTAEDSLAPNLLPQECGNHTDVRWASVTDGEGLGLLFEGDKFEFSALPWTPNELENAAHPHELPAVHYTVIRASLMQMGLGGDNSWGAEPRPEYLLPAEEMTFRFRFRGIGG